MRTAGIGAAILVSADEMLATVRNRYFCTMVVLGELANPDCLRFLESLREASPRSWLIVASDTVDEWTLDLAHRHGVDALIAMPIDTTELIRRIGYLRMRSRPIL
jgi:DNA-binding response OmpR family regulator